MDILNSYYNLSKATTHERAGKFSGLTKFRYENVRQYVQGKSVLDVGTGLGLGAEYLITHGAKKVLGIDQSKAAVVYANSKFKLKNLQFTVFRAQSIGQLNQNFSVILALELIEHLPKKEVGDFINSAYQKLPKGGYLIVSTPNCLQTRFKNPYHVQEFTAVELKQLLKQFFEHKIVGLGGGRQKLKLNKRQYVASWFGQWRLVQEILPWIPGRIKSSISLKTKSIKINQNLETCECLLAVAKK